MFHLISNLWNMFYVAGSAVGAANRWTATELDRKGLLTEEERNHLGVVAQLPSEQAKTKKSK